MSGRLQISLSSLVEKLKTNSIQTGQTLISSKGEGKRKADLSRQVKEQEVSSGAGGEWKEAGITILGS